MLNCLFRLTELCGGRVVVDGVDISTVGLKQLRSRLGIIPQVVCWAEWWIAYEYISLLLIYYLIGCANTAETSPKHSLAAWFLLLYLVSFAARSASE